MAARAIDIWAASALFLASAPAQAQSCYDLRVDRDAADRRGRFLVQDNPGTALVTVGCMAAAESEYRKADSARAAAGTFSVCGALGCGLTGDFQNCITKGTEIIFQAIRMSAAEDEMRRRRC